MIKTVSLHNFKCFNKKTEIPLSQITVMYGKNGRGKSSVSQSLLLIGQSMRKNNELGQLVINDGFVSQGLFKELINSTSNNSGFGISITSEKDENVSVYFSPIDNYPAYGQLSSLFVNGENRIDVKASSNNTNEDSSPSLGVTSDISLLQSLKEIVFISADRSGQVNSVKTEYPKGDVYLDPTGKNTINVLAEMGPDFISAIETALDYVLSGATISIKYNSDNIELGLNSSNGKATYRPTNVGYGYSYVLPVIVGASLAKTGNLVIIENPEAHLHPGAQSRLTEFLINLAKERQFQLIIESHSDHVINGIRIAAKKGLIDPKDCLIDHFSHSESSVEPTITVITCDKNGTLSEYPDDFMDEWTAQMLELV